MTIASQGENFIVVGWALQQLSKQEKATQEQSNLPSRPSTPEVYESFAESFFKGFDLVYETMEDCIVEHIAFAPESELVALKTFLRKELGKEGGGIKHAWNRSNANYFF